MRFALALLLVALRAVLAAEAQAAEPAPPPATTPSPAPAVSDSAAAAEPWHVTSNSTSAVKGADATRIFSFEGDVTITHGRLIATSDAARYFEGAARALLSGDVVMEQDTLFAKGPSAVYERTTRIATFPEGIVVERPSGTAIADRGVWSRDPGLFELSGNAAAADTSGTLDASSMLYDSRNDVFLARGEAKYVDEESGVTVTGGQLEYDRRRGFSRATSSPSAEFTESGAATPVQVFARTLDYDPRTNVAIAIRDVRILRESAEAFADSATFYREEERAVLTGSPRVIDGTTEISGDRIELVDEAPGRRRVLVTGSARVANRFLPDSTSAPVPAEEDSALVAGPPPAIPSGAGLPDSAAAFPDSAAAPADSTAAPDPRPAWLKIPGEHLPTQNLLFGDRMVLRFEDNELVNVEVAGHSRSKFYPNEDIGQLEEWNDVAGDTLHVWFDESSLDSVTVLGNGTGEYRLGPEPGGESTAGLDPAQLLEQGRLVKYRAPRIRFQRHEETMHLDRGAEVEYKTMVLRSGTIDFDAKTEVMDAGGEPGPTLIERGDEIAGREMKYHLDSRTGEIERGRTHFENGWYSGREVWLLDEETLAVESAAFTTCDREHPHFHFSSKRMKIYPDDKLVAKPVVLHIQNIPILPLPFYTASLKKERHSGFLFPNLELGVDESRGRFIRNFGYYWVPNDFTDLTTTFDFYPEQERVVGYLTGRYGFRYRCDGRLALKYNRDVPANRTDTVVEVDHRQRFSETSDLNASGRFLSSSSIYRDIDDVQRLDRDLRSYATWTKRFPGSNQSLLVEVERRENLDTEVINETLPSLQYSLPSREIRGSDIYSGLSLRAVRVHDRDTEGRDTEHAGSQVTSDLRGTMTVGPYARLTPTVTGEAAWNDEDRLGDPNAFRGTFGTSVGATSTIYGMYLKPLGPTQGFRHVVEPQVSWAWAPDFEQYFFADSSGARTDRFFSFGGIGGTPGKTNRGTLSLRNLLQTKMLRGGQVQRYDLFTLRNSISYDFLAEDFGRKPLSTLGSSLNILSSLPINQTWSVSHDPYSWDLLGTSVTTQLRLASSMLNFGRSSASATSEIPRTGDLPPPGGIEPTGEEIAPGTTRGLGGAGSWTLDASHSYQRGSGSGESSSRLVVGTSWIPTPKWRVMFNTQYDLRNGDNTAQQWSVHRLIHCWELSFDRRLLGNEWQYYLRIHVTDLPDIQAERGDRIQGSGLGGLSDFGL